MAQRNIKLYLNFTPFFLKLVGIFNEVFLEFLLFLDSEVFESDTKFIESRIKLRQYQVNTAFNLM